MHAAISQLHEEAGRKGHRRSLGLDVVFDPSPEAGRAAQGADTAFRDLIRTGFLREVGSGSDARLQVSETALVGARRDLMSLDAGAAALLQRAGSRWAALASTVSNSADSEVRSEGEIVTSGTA